MHGFVYFLATQRRQRNSRQKARNKRTGGSGGKFSGSEGATEGGVAAGEAADVEDLTPTGKLGRYL